MLDKVHNDPSLNSTRSKMQAVFALLDAYEIDRALEFETYETEMTVK